MKKHKAAIAGKQELSEAEGKRPLVNPTKAQLVLYRKKILQRITDDRLAHKFVLKLTEKHGFKVDEIIGGLLDNIFHEIIASRERLLASPTLPDSVREGMKYLSPGEWKENNPDPDLTVATKARELACAIEQAETNTPEFGLDQLECMKSRTLDERKQAVQELNELPARLRLYADYFEKSREWWRIIGRIEIEARTGFRKATRDLLQDQIRVRTGHYSDERFYRLLNIALDVVGKPQIDRNALTMRRARRHRAQRTSPKNQ